MEQIVSVNLSKADLIGWQQLPITQLVHNAIVGLIRESVLSLGDGVVLNSESPEATAQNYAKVVGYIAGLRASLNIEVENDDTEETRENAT